MPGWGMSFLYFVATTEVGATPFFSTWGNSGIEPDEGTGNQFSRYEAILMWPCNDGEQPCNIMLVLDASLKQTSICVVNQTTAGRTPPIPMHDR
jgi:hypothetical protein